MHPNCKLLLQKVYKKSLSRKCVFPLSSSLFLIEFCRLLGSRLWPSLTRRAPLTACTSSYLDGIKEDALSRETRKSVRQRRRPPRLTQTTSGFLFLWPQEAFPDMDRGSPEKSLQIDSEKDEKERVMLVKKPTLSPVPTQIRATLNRTRR